MLVENGHTDTNTVIIKLPTKAQLLVLDLQGITELSRVNSTSLVQYTVFANFCDMNWLFCTEQYWRVILAYGDIV